jgi:hypothetical protein
MKRIMIVLDNINKYQQKDLNKHHLIMELIQLLKQQMVVADRKVNERQNNKPMVSYRRFVQTRKSLN